MSKSESLTLDSDLLESHLEQALAAIEQAGDIALKYFRQPLSVDDKSGGASFDPVTKADREIEEFLRQELTARFPNYGIIGEEQEDYRPEASRRWVLDPIDGTRSFITGSPAWGILLGLLEDGGTTDDQASPVASSGAPRAVAGLMHQPFTGEFFFAATGHKSWLRQKNHNGAGQGDIRLQTRNGVNLGEAVVQCTHPGMFESEDELRDFTRVAEAARMIRFGGDCYSYCMLAMGQVDLVIESGLKPYDIVALIPIIEEAGGIVTNRDGQSATAGGFIVAAGNKDLHSQALELLNQ